MKQALLNDSRERIAPAQRDREVVGGTVSAEAAFALLRWENEGGSPLLCPGLRIYEQTAARLRQSDRMGGVNPRRV